MISGILLKETTKWINGTPNHTYVFDNKNSIKVKGYIPYGANSPIYFSSPMMFDRRNRTFEDVTSLYIDSLDSV